MAVRTVSFCDRLSNVAGHVQQFVSNCPSALFKRTVEPLVGGILKVSLFREAALQGRLGQWVILPLTAKIGNLWMRCQGLPPKFTVFDEERLKASRDFLANFGTTQTIETSSGRSLTFTHYSPEQFDEWIESIGDRDGEYIRPKNPDDLANFQKLRMFKFKENEDGSFTVPKRLDRVDQKCILHCNGFGLPKETAKGFIGRHLAAGFHYTIFEWGKDVSIPGFFEDAEAAYQATLGEGFRAEDITALGYCGTTYVVANLEKKHYLEGFNAVLIGPHTSFQDVVARANRVGLLGLGALETPDVNFNNIEKFKGLLRGGSGSICLIVNPKSQIATPDTVERLQDALRGIDHTVIVKPEDVSDEEFDFNKQFNIPGVWEGYIRFIIGRNN